MSTGLTRQPESLQQRISSELTRIIGSYVILITSLLAIITLLFGYYFNHNQLSHHRQLVSTKLVAEVSNVAYEIESLSTSTLVWTGLTDSLGRDSYLKPLLQQFNRGNLRNFLILDYRGRVVLGPDQPLAPQLMSHPAVIDAVSRGIDGYAMGLSPSGSSTIVLVHRVMSPISEGPVGFVMGSIDVGELVRTLNLSPLQVSFALGNSGFMPNVAGGLLVHDETQLMLRHADMDIDLRLRLARPILSSLVMILLVVFLVIMLGMLTLRRMNVWVQGFSVGTTERLEELVSYSRKVLSGEPIPPWQHGESDEISQLMVTLSDMMRQQKRITDELRTTSLVFSMAAEGIMVTAQHGNIIDVNPALLRMTGFQREELIGRLAGSLYRVSGHDDGTLEIAQALETQGHWSGETSFLHQQGHEIHTFIAVSRITGEGADLLGYVTVITDVGRLKQAETELRELAYRDSLTKLPNLRHMNQMVQQRLKTSREPFVLLFVDLDNLKTVNDTYDHEAGDWMICGMAEHLKRELPAGHLLCRRSGDEFIAVVDLDPSWTPVEWQTLLQRLTSAQVRLPSGEVQIGATIGVARYPYDALNWQGLQVCADVAMNEAKQIQRGTVAWYDNRLGQKVLRQRQIHQKLAQALEQGVITVHYQPIVHLATAQVLGFEALARWTDPELGAISPSEFIAVAEDAQLSDQLAMQLLQIILRDKPVIQRRFPGTTLAFNVAPRVFRDGRYINFLADRAIDEPGLLVNLEIELTESDISSSEDRLLHQLQQITGMGVQLVIDDFGKGYSSLSRLAQYPISCLKIDASFVSSLGVGRHTKIAELIVNLAQLLDLKVTAEGVETQKQRNILLEMGCTRGQGWLFSKAVSLEALLQLSNPLPHAPSPVQAEVTG